MQRASESPTIILHSYSDCHDKLCQVVRIDEWGDEANNIKPKLSKAWHGDKKFLREMKYFSNLRQGNLLSFSYMGLLVFGDTIPFIQDSIFHSVQVLNPITRSRIAITHHADDIMCGAYWAPNDNVYRVLWLSTIPKKGRTTIKILSMGSCSYDVKRKRQALVALPETRVPPVSVNGALHWMSEQWFTSCDNPYYIIRFSIETEEFDFKSPPEADSQPPLDNMQLLSIQGRLSYCRFSSVIDVWMLDDYNEWSWRKTHQVELACMGIEPIDDDDNVEVLGIQKGALVFRLTKVGLFAYHLEDKTFKKFMFEKMESHSVLHYSACLHTDSLLSLKAFPTYEKMRKDLLGLLLGWR